VQVLIKFNESKNSKLDSVLEDNRNLHKQLKKLSKVDLRKPIEELSKVVEEINR